MIPDYPADADGDALRRVLAGGSDMAEPMVVDFFVAVPDEASGLRVAAAVAVHGYRAKVAHDEDDDAWTCNCSKTMVATYEAVISSQDELARLAAEHGGEMDGWGTFGNVDTV